MFPQFDLIADKSVETTYLFSIDENEFYLADVDESTEKALLADGYEFCKLKVLRTSTPKWLCFAAVTGYQLASWYRANRFCGSCGATTKKGCKERMLYCEKCGNMVYPKICPAVIVAVTHGDKILLTKYSDKRNGTRYALIAGFAEIGETIEQTVKREVMEEVGIMVKNIRYYKSQPWSFTDTLLFGFYCELDGEESITLDENELSFAKWISRDELTITDDDISLTYEMISRFFNEPQSFN